MTVATTTRNADLSDLASLLQAQHDAKHDVVLAANKLHSYGTLLAVDDSEHLYRPTTAADSDIAGKLGIPLAYLRRLRDDAPDLYDENVNGWLSRDDRRFLVRTFKSDDPSEWGVARALLSSNYRIVDNLDVLTAALDGVRAAGVPVNIDGCDLSERRMYVRVSAPEVFGYAPTLLKNYKSPFTGQNGADNPVVFAGFVISNSETGGGAFTIVPRLVVQVCKNGMTINKDALRSVHIGGKLDEGVIRWSNETNQRSLELVTSQARDAVQTFLDVDYVTKTLEAIEVKATEKIDKPAEKLEIVCSKLAYPKERTEAIFDHFIQGGDITAGGIMQAITSVAQTIDDADVAFDMEADALRALELAVH